jgi:hypothetical protein
VSMDLQLLKQADQVLSKCGGRAFEGGSIVPLQKSFLMPMVLQPGQSTIYTKEITGETTWALRAISSDQTSAAVTGVRIQIQLPNGRFLIGGNGQDVGQFAWVGSWRYLMDPEVDCFPGSKIQITLTDTVGLQAALAVNLLFEGAYKFLFRDGRPAPLNLASKLPRYQAIVDEGILAPCFTGGVAPTTVPDDPDELFTYASRIITIPTAGPLTATAKIPIDPGIDFSVRKIHVDVSGGAGATAGTVLARVRSGTGYALNDDFIDYARYIGGAEWAHDWKVRGEGAVFIDLQLVDTTGAGNIFVQFFLEGVKRRRA